LKKPSSEQQDHGSIRFENSGSGVLRIQAGKKLDAVAVGKVWKDLARAIEKQSPDKIVVEAGTVENCDGAGLAFLFDLKRMAESAGAQFEVVSLAERFRHLLDFFDPEKFKQKSSHKKLRSDFFSEVGKAAVGVVQDIRQMLVFTGELTLALFRGFLHPRQVRWSDAFYILETAGVNALPIILLLGFLIGLILAFQSAMVMRIYGAEIFVANLVSLSLLRELGPLITAILLAGRSGSSFAAELGTMKVNEEIDALTTMGLQPVRFLAVPRVLAAVVATPLLTLFTNLSGLVGGALVLVMLGIPLNVYTNQVISAVDLSDLFGGLFKSLVFGILVSAIGCLRGLQTKTGASAVGDSTTRAVVSGIVLIVISDGVFSVLFYVLDI
jgi:phospholipid/cholesterol/gamma-HCH transport system permease protein